MNGWRISLKSLWKQIKEIILCSIIFILVVGMMFFAMVGLISWERGFVW